MTSPYVGEIQLFGFDFNPADWAYCNGATLPVQQNTMLFSLLGITYGGNGSSTFQLPNFSGRAGCEQGQGTNLTARQIGSTFGNATASLLTTQIPPHDHGITAYSQPDATKKSGMPANGSALSTMGSGSARPFGSPPTDATCAPTMITPTGNGLPHENQQPYLAVNFCIALVGEYPQFS
ncbi:phage tail protein [Xanthomonas hortorum]|uniref:Phage tail protein n=1 Tax=Xanthomonas hortorum pv. pelargonii TaxID=453602 RepID=A0A6V7F9Q0_9XANT|nr:tail fiber protein [Xanthomonas hortorum]MCE4355005.1 tail fiber protein [Xanthomonas hortorum pv. pelargonii]MCM5522947.1 tail fiber protein [Xanthomonas hortorum pv. pelargonii]MCM5535162.1 tail fiber protein [Xanthomonas hortorum pv. pelargonii]MCM5539291.1 tail fiber protein [Xanthomonas hortorum pv. pelargonii]MCM5543441.1 tail fiber protein [Xanthomonas hortorum pv. pelargonii]